MRKQNLTMVTVSLVSGVHQFVQLVLQDEAWRTARWAMSFYSENQGWFRLQLAKGSEGLQLIVRHTRTMTLLLKHRDVPWVAKLVAACSVGYILSPIQLIPTFIPVIGQLDDIAVLVAGMKLLRKLTPASLLAECEAQVPSRTYSLSPQQLPPVEYRRPEAAYE